MKTFVGPVCQMLSTRVDAVKKLKLSSGHEIPIIALGTGSLKADQADQAVTSALECGYRHIDTSVIHQNEEAIGKSLKKWFNKGNKREDVFITSKLPPIGNRAADVEKYLKMSLNNLGLDYVDMYLIHMPFGFLSEAPGGLEHARDFAPVLDFATDHLAVWKAMEAQVKAGRAKSIGLSNFNESQILRILKNAEIQPSNLQIEVQAYNQQKPLREFCAKHNITVTGYRSLGSESSTANIRGKGVPKLLENPTIAKIAKAHKKTPAQVLLRYSVQNGIIVTPKSSKPMRIKENHDIFDFELTADDMREINDLDMGEDGRLIKLFIYKGVEKHPEYPWTSQIKNAPMNR